MIVLTWIAVLLLTTTERKAAISSVSQDTANLSRAFEENVVRTVHDIDRTLLLLRRTHQANPDGLDWPAQLKDALLASDTTVQLAVIGADGILLATDLEVKTGQAIRLDDRLHFRVHAEADDDFLYISKPVLGRASGKWTVQFTRRLVDAGGRFAGVVVASFDPGHFARFYESVQIGEGGSVLLVGLDGVIRAGGGTAKLGTVLPDDNLLAELRRRASGTVMMPPQADAPIPHRLVPEGAGILPRRRGRGRPGPTGQLVAAQPQLLSRKRTGADARERPDDGHWRLPQPASDRDAMSARRKIPPARGDARQHHAGHSDGRAHGEDRCHEQPMLRIARAAQGVLRETGCYLRGPHRPSRGRR